MQRRVTEVTLTTCAWEEVDEVCPSRVKRGQMKAMDEVDCSHSILIDRRLMHLTKGELMKRG